MSTKTKTLIERINEILENSELTDPHEVAAVMIDGMEVEEQLEAFAHILPAYVSSKMSYMAPPSVVPFKKDPEAAVLPFEKKESKPGVPWFKQSNSWDKKRLSSGTPGLWVFWKDFSTDMCSAKIEELNKRISTMGTSIEKYSLIKTTLLDHNVTKVGDLPVGAKKSLEEALGALPDD